MFQMFKDYVAERYGDLVKNPSLAAETYWEISKDLKRSFKELPEGFFTCKPEGDALIVYDIYIKPAHRGKEGSRSVFKAVIETAKDLQKNVLIGFKEHFGSQQANGHKAMMRQDFKPYMELRNETCYIRGVY
jgi:hypothetical protein